MRTKVVRDVKKEVGQSKEDQEFWMGGVTVLNKAGKVILTKKIKVSVKT